MMGPLLRQLLPDASPISKRERLRCAAGALIGILATGFVSHAALGAGAAGSDLALPAMIAPMGASAVLLFAVPSSPLAQPWSILGGNLVAAMVGVTAAAVVPNPLLAAAIAIGCAIALMMALRCLHPPSGAVALTAVLAGPEIRDLGYAFVLWPVGANSLLLLATALLFNNLTGRPYPQVLARKVVARAPADRDAGTSRISGDLESDASDLDDVLKDFDGVLDVGRADLETILRRMRLRAYRRRTGSTTCGEIMARDVVAIAPCAPLHDALELLRRHAVKALPVTDESARVLGIVTQTDLLDKTVWERLGPRLGWRRRIRLTLRRGRAPAGTVDDIMTSPVRTVRPETPIADIVVGMLEAGLLHLPVVGADGKLVGVVSQTDLVAALLADRSDEPEGRRIARPTLASPFGSGVAGQGWTAVTAPT